MAKGYGRARGLAKDREREITRKASLNLTDGLTGLATKNVAWGENVEVVDSNNLFSQDLDWVCINDTVMGGCSSSKVEGTNGGLLFRGQLSLKNGGGFASMRNLDRALGLDGAEGVRIRVRGDGRSFLFCARRYDITIRAGGYRHPFTSHASGETDICLPFSDFYASSFGHRIDAPPLEEATERIVSLGVMLADKSPGPFQLEILALELYGRDSMESSPEQPLQRRRVLKLLCEAIHKGVPIYNGGDALACAKIYKAAIQGALLLSDEALYRNETDLLMDSLSISNTLPTAEHMAWALRRAMDVVLSHRSTN